MLDDDLCKLVAGFDKKTKSLFMLAECYSAGVLDLKFALKSDASSKRMSCKRMKKIREVKSRTVLASAVDPSQVSLINEHRTYFACGLEKMINGNFW